MRAVIVFSSIRYNYYFILYQTFGIQNLQKLGMIITKKNVSFSEHIIIWKIMIDISEHLLNGGKV